MPTEFQAQCDAIEEGYEFTLSYAAQGHATDVDSPQGRQLREHLTRSVQALRGLEGSLLSAVESGQLTPVEPYRAFHAVLARDAADSVAAVELVLAQQAISSQLIDSLNASIHLRALLTDIFLVAEILEAQQAHAAVSESMVG